MSTTATAVEIIGQGGNLPAIISRALAPVEKAVPEKFDIVAAPVVPDAKAIEAAKTAVLKADPLTVTERRTLAQSEIDQLMAERLELDELEKYIKARKAAMRTMVFNHLDIEVEAADIPVEADSSGHYIAKGEAPSTHGKKFTRELRTGSPVVTADALQQVVEEGLVPEEVFSHEDYLACTTQVRVLDEEKTMIHLRTNPDAVAALQAAATPGKVTASLNKR